MKKKKKRKVLSKKEKMIITIIGILAFILIVALAMLPTKIKETGTSSDDETTLDRELETVQEVVEYLESTFISMKTTTVDGYDTDIYVSFKYNLFEGNESKETYFKNFYEKIAMVTKFKSFRIIDEDKDITIEVKCSSNKITEVKINGETDYYKNQASKSGKNNELNVENVDIPVDSKELQDLINAKWVTANVNLGTAESTYDKYKIYFDEGYEVRTIKGKVYNIVFTSNYKGKVIGGYKVGDSIEKVKSEYGTSYEGSDIAGYKTQNFYAMFSEDSISIYPNNQYDYTEFEKLVEEYNDKKDANDFMDKLTDIWPDYNEYNYDTNYVEIYYTLKGVRISFASHNQDGIEIYENYKGDLKREKTDYKNTYYNLDQDLIVQSEERRRLSEMDLADDCDEIEDPLLASNKFTLQMERDDDGYYYNIKINPRNNDYPKNELDETIRINKYIWADDSNLVYSISGDGIYVYNAETRETKKLIEENEALDITDYDRQNKILTYDDKKVVINF